MRGSEIGIVGEGEDRKRGKHCQRHNETTLIKLNKKLPFKCKKLLSISPQSVSSCSIQHVVKLPKVVDKVFRS